MKETQKITKNMDDVFEPRKEDGMTSSSENANSLILKEADLNEINKRLLIEIIERLWKGDNLAFIEQNNKHKLDLAIYSLEAIDAEKGEMSESVIKITEGLMHFIKKDKQSIATLKDSLELTKSVFELSNADPKFKEIRKEALDYMSDRISQSLAESLKQNTHINEELKENEEYTVFLSYSSMDRDEAREIEKLLQEAGVSCFLDEKKINPGQDWGDEIKKALRNCREFWLLVSPRSLTSDWVKTEWGAAWILDKKIMPIFYQCTPDQLPQRLRKFQGVDFYKVGSLIKLSNISGE